MNTKKLMGIGIGVVVLGFAMAWFAPNAFADAARLEAAIRSTGTNFRSFAIAGLSVGVAVSGLCFALGAAQLGRMLLFSIVLGAVITFGGQSLIGMLQNAFR